jgi:hypothetical protein
MLDNTGLGLGTFSKCGCWLVLFFVLFMLVIVIAVPPSIGY